jgi:hypothetical protein
MGAISVPLSVVQTATLPVKPIANGLDPPNLEALAVPVTLNYSPTIQGYLIDLTEAAVKLNTLPVQGVWIDLAQCPVNLDLIVPQTSQGIIARGYTQGYYTIVVPMPVKLAAVLAGSVAVATPVTIILYNTPVSSRVWTTQ